MPSSTTPVPPIPTDSSNPTSSPHPPRLGSRSRSGTGEVLKTGSDSGSGTVLGVPNSGNVDGGNGTGTTDVGSGKTKTTSAKLIPPGTGTGTESEIVVGKRMDKDKDKDKDKRSKENGNGKGKGKGKEREKIIPVPIPVPGSNSNDSSFQEITTRHLLALSQSLSLFRYLISSPPLPPTNNNSISPTTGEPITPSQWRPLNPPSSQAQPNPSASTSKHTRDSTITPSTVGAAAGNSGVSLNVAANATIRPGNSRTAVHPLLGTNGSSGNGSGSGSGAGTGANESGSSTPSGSGNHHAATGGGLGLLSKKASNNNNTAFALMGGGGSGSSGGGTNSVPISRPASPKFSRGDDHDDGWSERGRGKGRRMGTGNEGVNGRGTGNRSGNGKLKKYEEEKKKDGEGGNENGNENISNSPTATISQAYPTSTTSAAAGLPSSSLNGSTTTGTTTTTGAVTETETSSSSNSDSTSHSKLNPEDEEIEEEEEPLEADDASTSLLQLLPNTPTANRSRSNSSDALTPLSTPNANTNTASASQSDIVLPSHSSHNNHQHRSSSQPPTKSDSIRSRTRSGIGIPIGLGTSLFGGSSTAGSGNGDNPAAGMGMGMSVGTGMGTIRLNNRAPGQNHKPRPQSLFINSGSGSKDKDKSRFLRDREGLDDEGIMMMNSPTSTLVDEDGEGKGGIGIGSGASGLKRFFNMDKGKSGAGDSGSSGNGNGGTEGISLPSPTTNTFFSSNFLGKRDPATSSDSSTTSMLSKSLPTTNPFSNNSSTSLTSPLEDYHLNNNTPPKKNQGSSRLRPLPTPSNSSSSQNIQNDIIDLNNNSSTPKLKPRNKRSVPSSLPLQQHQNQNQRRPHPPPHHHRPRPPDYFQNGLAPADPSEVIVHRRRLKKKEVDALNYPSHSSSSSSIGMGMPPVVGKEESIVDEGGSGRNGKGSAGGGAGASAGPEVIRAFLEVELEPEPEVEIGAGDEGGKVKGKGNGKGEKRVDEKDKGQNVGTTTGGGFDLEAVRAVLEREEVRSSWDKLVERSSVIDTLDPHTRISKTEFKLGWPANPRDAITISRTYMTPSVTNPNSTTPSPPPTLLSICTSVPPSPGGSSSDPAFLRPAPPYVRSKLYLWAWCVQVVGGGYRTGRKRRQKGKGDKEGNVKKQMRDNSTNDDDDDGASGAEGVVGEEGNLSLMEDDVEKEGEEEWVGPRRLRITVFWQWDLRGAVFSTHQKEIATLLSSFVGYLRSSSPRVPLLANHGRLVSLLPPPHTLYDPSGDAFTVAYSVVASDEVEAIHEHEQKGLEEVKEDRERKRKGFDKAMEISLSGKEGWDIRVEVVGKGEGTDTSWSVTAEQRWWNVSRPFNKSGSSGTTESAACISEPITLGSRPGSNNVGMGQGRILLRFVHAGMERLDQFVRVKVVVQRLAGAGGKVLRVNGKDVRVQELSGSDFDLWRAQDAGGFNRLVGPRGGDGQDQDDFSMDFSFTVPTIGDGASILTGETASTVDSALSISTMGAGAGALNTGLATLSKKSAKILKAEKVQNEIAEKIRRSYIYFTSLLQEPEAKWRRISDSRGVTVSQLRSIDPTLTIYRAEATFVGVGVWDLFSTITTAGARMEWDKTIQEISLVEDVSDLSTIWHLKTKASWPTSARDSVQLRTSYKSPTTVHIFASSCDDRELFPSIPPVESGTIRTQTDLHGWSIEALSPTTTQVTLLDQSDPKGWSSSRTWTPTYLINSVAAVGEYSIKSGGPPVVTRILGAKANSMKYDHDKGTFRTEYSPSLSMHASVISWLPDRQEAPPVDAERPYEIKPDSIECEIRCDCTTWAPCIDVIIDPPPTKVSCLRRHRLSAGGGTWLSIEHDSNSLENERILVLVRRGPGNREKGSVFVNGSKTKVDTEELPEDELKLLSNQKRIRASPFPLDQYASLPPKPSRTGTPTQAHTPLISPSKLDSEDPFKGASLTPPGGSTASLAAQLATLKSPPKQQPPLAYGLEALSWLQQFHLEQGADPSVSTLGWSDVSASKSGITVRKKIVPYVSQQTPVYRVDNVIEGATASELANIICSPECRKEWDDRVDTIALLESFGQGCYSSAYTTKSAFPTKGKLYHVANASAQFTVPSSSSTSSTTTVLFVASASIPPSEGDQKFDWTKVNPNLHSTGQLLLEGWILQSVDPYTSNTYAIPSTHCTHFLCAEQSAMASLTFSSLNSQLTRLLAGLEEACKRHGPLPNIAYPPSALEIDGLLSADPTYDSQWRLTEKQSSGRLILSNFAVNQNEYRVLGLTSMPLPERTVVNSVIEAEMARQRQATDPEAGPTTSPKLKSNRRETTQAIPQSSSSGNSLKTKTSTPSLPLTNSPRQRLRSSSTAFDKRAEPEHETDLVISEVVVDLKRYVSGYDITCSGTLRPKDTQNEAPLNLDWKLLSPESKIPLKASIHITPLPPIISASDQTATPRVQHLVRVTCPTAEYSNPALDPLRDGLAPPFPGWYRRLAKGDAVVFDLRIISNPLGSPSGSPSRSPIRVTFNGERLSIMNERDTRATLGRDEEEDWLPDLPKLSRVALPIKSPREPGSNDPGSKVLPDPLGKPLAIAARLIKPPEPPKPSPAPITETPLPSDSGIKDASPSPGLADGKTPEVVPTPSGTSEKSPRPTHPKERAASNPLFNLPGAYFLQRLQSAGLSSSRPSTPTPTPSSTNQGSTTISTVASQSTSQNMYSLQFVITITIIAFLLGSFLRSLVSPVDFIVFPPSAYEPGRKGGLEDLLLDVIDPARRWRECRRLLQLRFPLTPWDLVFAAVRRR